MILHLDHYGFSLNCQMRRKNHYRSSSAFGEVVGKYLEDKTSRRGSRFFSRGGGIFDVFSFFPTFFLGRPNGFSELSKTTIKTLICQIFWPQTNF